MAVVPFVQASVAFLLVADRLLSRHGSPCPLLLSPSFVEQTYNAVSTCSSCNAATGDSEGVGADCPVCGEGGGVSLALRPRCLTPKGWSLVALHVRTRDFRTSQKGVSLTLAPAKSPLVDNLGKTRTG